MDDYITIGDKRYRTVHKFVVTEVSPSLEYESITVLEEMPYDSYKPQPAHGAPSEAELDEKLDDLLYDYWVSHRDCRDGCVSPEHAALVKTAIKEEVAKARIDEADKALWLWRSNRKGMNGYFNIKQTQRINDLRAELRKDGDA